MTLDDELSADTFYRDFEDRFRGGRAEIQRRLQVYLPFLLPLIEEGAAPHALDLGCGRGEWLELLGRHGFDARGVDLDEGMLTACRQAGLHATCEDAVRALRSAENGSLLAVSGFHLAEHMPFDSVRELLAEAHRTLEPGGVLVLETPNPENLAVGTEKFYLDPSHLHPLPPDLLQFTVERAGFGLSTVLRLQEDPALVSGRRVDLLAVLRGVSPDYAVVAQKSGSERRSNALKATFEMQRGLTLDDLASAFDLDQQQRHQRQVDRSLQQREDVARSLLDGLRGELREELRAVRQDLEELRRRDDVSQANLRALRSSTSWRVTAPLRAVSNGFKTLRRRVD